jgi:hypothetical protein
VSDEERTLRINWVQVLSGALAAMSSAVLLSTVGVAGTIIGAAIGSVVATVASALYSHYLAVSKARLSEAQTAAFTRVSRARSSVRGAAADLHHQRRRAGRELEQAAQELDHAETELRDGEQPTAVRWKELLAGLPWKRIALVAAALFVAVMIVITAFELLTGRALSTYTGGSHTGPRTSISGLTGGSGGQQTPGPSAPTSTASPTAPASAQPGLPTPSSSESAPSTEAPSAAPTAAPTGEPTVAPTAEPSGAPTEPSAPGPAPTVSPAG